MNIRSITGDKAEGHVIEGQHAEATLNKIAITVLITSFLGCAAILAAAQPLKIVFVVVVVVAAKSTFTIGLLM